nr:hypothetical protein [Tanacetum cinerariifolium]
MTTRGACDQLLHHEVVKLVDEWVEELEGLGSELMNLRVEGMTEVLRQIEGINRNQNGDSVNGNIEGDARNVIENNGRRGCSYKKFLACNLKEYDGKGGVIVYTRWIENMELVQDMSGFIDDQKVKLVPHLVTPENKKIERNGSLKKNPKKRGNGGGSSRDRNGRDDNQRTRTGNGFGATTNPVRREYTGTTPKCANCNLHHPLESPCRVCFNCNRPGHIAKDCRIVPKMVNTVNARNPTAAPRACFECGGTDHLNTACPRLNQAQRLRAFMLGAEEARQYLNIVTGIEPTELGFSYAIEKASGQLVEIKKVIRNCKLAGSPL